jgi:hypothetical protein
MTCYTKGSYKIFAVTMGLKALFKSVPKTFIFQLHTLN